MKSLQIGTIKPRCLTKHDRQIWHKYMTPEYVYMADDGQQYVYMRFEGYDHMEEEWRIVKIAKVR